VLIVAAGRVEAEPVSAISRWVRTANPLARVYLEAPDWPGQQSSLYRSSVALNDDPAVCVLINDVPAPSSCSGSTVVRVPARSM